MKTATRKAIAQYDEACQAAQRRIDNEWIDRRLADMTVPADEFAARASTQRQAEYAAAKLALAAEYGIPANLA
jgi:hypothetical protein